MLSTLELSPQSLDAQAPVRIAVKNLDFYYGEHKALKNINLDFRDRHVTALIGPSGCGKSTLLRIFKSDFTIAIVTHNMQQAARISQYTAFMYLGEVIEFAPTNTIFMNPAKKQTQDYVTGRFG